jgi:glutamate carboxypeptidase
MNQQKEIEKYLNNNLDRFIDLLQKMVAINSFTANSVGVNALGEYTAHLFSELGFVSSFVQSTNPNYGKHMFASIPINDTEPQKPTIGLISHLDTVYPPEEEKENHFFWREKGDRLYGPGTVDIKGGTLMIYMILDVLSKFYPKYFKAINWKICLNASEETLGNDFGNLCRDQLQTNTIACLIFEAGNQSNGNFSLVTSRKGRATFFIQVEGRSAHAGNNHADGANAIHQIARTIDKVSSLTNYKNNITFNVGSISGGTVVNRVPHYAKAKGEMRAFSIDVFNQGVKDILNIMEDPKITASNGFKSKVKITISDRTDPWPINTDTEDLFAHFEEAADKLGFEVKEQYRGGLSDGNLLWSHFPTIDGLGPSGGNAHCSQISPDGSKDQEFVLKSSFVPKTLLDVSFLLNIIEKNNPNF